MTTKKIEAYFDLKPFDIEKIKKLKRACTIIAYNSTKKEFDDMHFDHNGEVTGFDDFTPSHFCFLEDIIVP
jgi:hypothetical protein